MLRRHEYLDLERREASDRHRQLVPAQALVGGLHRAVGQAKGAAAAPTSAAATGVPLVASRERKAAVERPNGVLAVAVWMAGAARPTTVASSDPVSFDRVDRLPAGR